MSGEDRPQALRGTVVTPFSVIDDAVVALSAGGIVELVAASTWSGPTPEPVGTIAPGFIDMHCHGGGGRSVTTGAPDDIAAVAAHHRSRGTTSLVASMVSGTQDDLLAGLRGVAEVAAVDAGVIGTHLEGPWLAHGHCGAHDPAVLSHPDVDVAREWLQAAAGTLRMVTIAPDLPGFAAAARVLAEAGVLVAAGHTDADTATFAAALASDDVATVTHLFNGMAPFHHRDPGPAGATLRALAAGQVHAELISDGIHLADETVALAFGVAPDRIVLISDAMSAAGMPDGQYRLGALDVEVRDATAWTTGPTPVLAGSTLHVGEAVRRAITGAGVDPAIAIRAATTTPAGLLGITDRGRVAEGLRADLVVLDEDWAVSRVMHGGAWV
ncbi:N-acetylglucosamine-6-phosphate deacetylase [Nocardioides sp.]|uniref:N-acetylglucosamine-6-phosphate deacetylase n=1 Tax=Nocardioides sp. TaxID=35761 RepID=UPI002625D8CE|nr:N-acetylglucosamine-6-phosphate deacetylase [Nocardioides sp.]